MFILFLLYCDLDLNNRLVLLDLYNKNKFVQQIMMVYQNVIVILMRKN